MSMFSLARVWPAFVARSAVLCDTDSPHAVSYSVERSVLARACGLSLSSIPSIGPTASPREISLDFVAARETTHLGETITH